jgi:hypothetical protein
VQDEPEMGDDLLSSLAPDGTRTNRDDLLPADDPRVAARTICERLGTTVQTVSQPDESGADQSVRQTGHSNELVDVKYELAGRTIVATGLDIVAPSE